MATITAIAPTTNTAAPTFAAALTFATDPTVATGQDGDDPVGLTELLGAQNDALVPIERHPRASGKIGEGVTDAR